MSHLGECYFHTASSANKSTSTTLTAKSPPWWVSPPWPPRPPRSPRPASSPRPSPPRQPRGALGLQCWSWSPVKRRGKIREWPRVRCWEGKGRGKPLLKREAPYEGKLRRLLLHEPGRQTIKRRTTNLNYILNLKSRTKVAGTWSETKLICRGGFFLKLAHDNL